MKILTLILILLLSLTLFSCGDKQTGIDKLAKRAATDSSAANELIKILSKDQSSARRSLAAKAIGNAKVKNANSILLKALENDDDNVRTEVVLALGKLQIEANLPVILKVFNNQNEKFTIRNNAVMAIGYFSTNLAINTLIKNIETETSEFRAISIRAMKNTNSTKAAAYLLKKLIAADSSHSQIADSLANLKKPNTFDGILTIITKKVMDRNYDTTYQKLLQMICKVKYEKAKNVLIKSFLIGNLSNITRKVLKKTLMDMKLKDLYIVVSSGAMNLRSKPNTRSSVNGIINIGELGQVTEKSNIKYNLEGNENFWYKVILENGKTGWLFGAYIRIFDPKKLKAEQQQG